MMRQFKQIKALSSLRRTHRGLILSVIVLGVLSALAEGIGISLFIPLLHSLDPANSPADTGNRLGNILGRFFSDVPPEKRLFIVSACIFGSVVVKSALNYGSGILSSWFDARLGHHLRTHVFGQLLSVGYGFIERSQSGDLLNTFSTETWRTTEALHTLIGIIITVCTLAVYVGLLLLISWKLTLLVTVVMLAIAAVVHFLTRRVKAFGRLVTKVNSTLAVRMVESLEAMKLIRVFGREPYEGRRFDDASERMSRVYFKLGLLSGLVSPVYQILSAALLVSILFVSLQSPANLPALLVFIFILYRLQPKIQALDGARIHLLSLLPAVQKVNSLLDRADKPYIISGSTPVDRLDDAICFEHVTFRYGSGERPALEDASFVIPAGKTTALVGPSGAGKSTVIKLLLRLYDVDQGTITVDGKPLGALDTAEWRDRIAIVTQDVYVFNATVRDNIAYGRLDATEEEIVEAAKQADAHDFICRLPHGYDTKLGDRGVRLSGGQKQRITLARAIVRDPEILILDEATNSLDTLSEHLIQETLFSLGRNRTVIIIAHRLSTIERADNIIVLDDGRVRERGSLHYLLKNDDLFARLHELQYRRALTSQL